MAAISWKNAWMGAVVYATGDSIASCLIGEFLVQRMLGMFILGGGLYAWEIPAYFQYLDRCFQTPGILNSLKRMFFAVIFFNPIWITRHLVFIQLFTGQWPFITLDLLPIAMRSFAYVLPVSLVINYMIQNKISLTWRYFASSLFSAFMAIYFALSEVLFG